MRIVFITNHFCDGMGYLENMLPKYFGRMGHETHVITADIAGNSWIPSFEEIYGTFSKPLPAGFTRTADDYTLHVMSHRVTAGYARIVGLGKKLAELRPDVVQTTTPIGWNALQAAYFKAELGYSLFTGNHHHASVFPLAQKADRVASKERLACIVKRTLPGRFISLFTEKCYAITQDCADIAARFFGVQKHKIDICPLGVDTGLFRPISSDRDYQERLKVRRQMGFADQDVVCVYTGRFTADKNPLLLAKAVEELARKGEPFRALFVGNGPQNSEISSCFGCVVHPFVSVGELPRLYRAADIAVWPAQESLSMLDAAACGLPIVVNHTMSAPERIEGNGLTYQLNDGQELVGALRRLRDPAIRAELGVRGAEKMRGEFSWAAISARRLRDYEMSLEQVATTRSPEVRPHSSSVSAD